MSAASLSACAIAAGLSLGVTTSVSAQTVATPVTELDALIVTATKRNESVRDVAIPISAVSGADLQKVNANSLADYIVRLPGVTFNDYQPGISEVVVRGIAATTYHEQGQTTTGYYLNEVVVVEPGFPIGIPDVDTFDLDRVEVLRGPQGTLFGSSTLGGLVNYVAKMANTSQYQAAASGLVGTTKNAGQANYAIKAMVNIPIIEDKLGVRLTGLQRFDAGFLDNPGTKEDGVNDFRTRGLRGSLVFTPAEGTKLTFLSAYQDSLLDDQTYLSHDYVRNSARAEPQETDFWLNSLRLDQDVGFADLTLLGSTNHKTNSTTYSYPYAYVTGVTTGSGSAYSLGAAKADIDTFEGRLASKEDDRLKWLIGASYMRAKKSSADRIYQPGAAAYITAHPGDFGGYSGSVLAPGDAIYGYISDTVNKDFGIFGEVQVQSAVGDHGRRPLLRHQEHGHDHQRRRQPGCGQLLADRLHLRHVAEGRRLHAEGDPGLQAAEGRHGLRHLFARLPRRRPEPERGDPAGHPDQLWQRHGRQLRGRPEDHAAGEPPVPGHLGLPSEVEGHPGPSVHRRAVLLFVRDQRRLGQGRRRRVRWPVQGQPAHHLQQQHDLSGGQADDDAA
jgi:outer membrane receptor protein involved in Fe transport